MHDALAWLTRLTSWLEEFEPAFSRRALRGGLRRYVEGVLSDSRRKSMEAMWARLRDPGSYQALQYFITEADWNADEVWRRLRAAIPARDGILGAVLSQRAPVSLIDLKPTFVLPYYAEGCPVQTVCGVPVFERGQLRGVLVVDRRESKAFQPEEEELCEQAARFAARAIENERQAAREARFQAEREAEAARDAERRTAARLGATIPSNHCLISFVLVSRRGCPQVLNPQTATTSNQHKGN